MKVKITREVGAIKNSVSIVVPAYNEELAVGKQIVSIQKEMDKSEWIYEIIAVNDGSTDSTLSELKNLDIEILNFKINRGYGASLKAGISKSKYDYILITDADGTYNSKEIPGILREAVSNDMVVGSRVKEGIKIPLSKRIAKWILKKLASYLAGEKIPDLNSGLRIMRKSVLEKYLHILPSGFSFTTTITLCMICNGHMVHYEPIGYEKRIGKSKIRPFDFYNFLILILRTIVLFNPLKIFLPLGTMFFMLGLLKLFIIDIPIGNLSETVVMGFLAAFIIWAIGLLSDQVARVGLEQR